MTEKAIIILNTSPDEDTAEHIATELVQAKLAACVSILPKIRSIYEWKGNIEKKSEYLLIAKTTEALYTSVEKAILAVHPYEVPEIVAIPITSATCDYLDWITNTVTL